MNLGTSTHAELGGFLVWLLVVDHLELEASFAHSSWRFHIGMLVHFVELVIFGLQRHSVDLEAALQVRIHRVDLVEALDRTDLVRRVKYLAF